MSWIDFVGYLAALMVLATFCMDTIVPLRGLAIASNVLFILYGIAVSGGATDCASGGRDVADR
jgi:hypothetical protein